MLDKMLDMHAKICDNARPSLDNAIIKKFFIVVILSYKIFILEIIMI